MASLQLSDVTVEYGQRIAVDSLSFEVAPGEILGLLGPNGSGKSTTMAVCAGVLQPRQGRVTINGLEPIRQRREYTKHVGFVPQEIALYEELTIADNLRFFGRLFGVYGRSLTSRVEAAAELVCLADRLNSRVSTLSGGMQRRVNLACALIHEPLVILLDEPTAALDPTSRQLLYETLGRLRSAGRAILFTTHHLDEAEQWCDRIAIIRQGKLIAIGRPDEIGPRTNRLTMIGRLREEISEALEVSIRAKLADSTEFHLDGRSFEISAIDAEMLGFSLAILHAEGADVESFRTPTTRLEQLYTEADSGVNFASVALAKGA